MDEYRYAVMIGYWITFGFQCETNGSVVMRDTLANTAKTGYTGGRRRYNWSSRATNKGKYKRHMDIEAVTNNGFKHAYRVILVLEPLSN